MEAPDPFREKLSKIMEEERLSLEQIYNCGETGLYYRMLPEKTLAARSGKEAPGMKNSKERVTLMACSNATSSHKLPLMFIGKAQKPRCFKDVNMSALPVRYYTQKSAWVNFTIFADWFQEELVPSVKKHLSQMGVAIKALLLLDNAPSHPDESALQSSGKCI